MSIADKAARGALWTVATSIGGRAVGVVGTLVLTRYISPETIGEVTDALILCLTASWLTIWGFGQYTVVNGRGADAREVAWHATVAYVGLGVLSIGAVALLADPLADFVSAPHAAEYIPGLALAVLIRRLGAMPERILAMRMQFRAAGMANAGGELVFAATAVTLAAFGWGGRALVIANLAKSIVSVAILFRAAGFGAWATPTRLRWARFADMLRFGVPLGVQGVAHSASRYWDNLTVSHFFGPGAAGAYNMAYNLADIPAIQVGEQIALVLLPSLAELPPERRAGALERSTALLSLVLFPLAVGLGLVAQPLIALVLPANKWQEVGPLLVVLAALSVFRPITWVLSAYMEAERKTNRLMGLELAKLVVLLGGIAALAPLGLRAAASAVGIAFGATAIAGVALVAREGPSPLRLFVGFVQPLAACAVMAAVVLGARGVMDGVSPGVELAVEIPLGAIAYVAAAFAIAGERSRDLLELVKRAMRRRHS
jgi:PST family polysaccharide transporter